MTGPIWFSPNETRGSAGNLDQMPVAARFIAADRVRLDLHETQAVGDTPAQHPQDSGWGFAGNRTGRPVSAR